MRRAFSLRLGFLATIGVLSAIAAQPHQGSPASRPVRVLLASSRTNVDLPLSGPWRLVEPLSRRVLVSGDSTRHWGIQRDGRRLRAVHGDSPASPWVEGSIAFERTNDADVTWQQKPYRGVLVFTATDTATLIINRLDVEDYLRGVLPLEIGARLTSDHAAVEAQAVAARSFTYTRMLARGARDFDVTGTETDQVYGGVAVETFWGDLAVAATAGWVLSYRGQVVTGPYHSACGGSTALPSEVWRGGQDGFLRSVSDTAPNGRPWCDLAPRAQWERRFSATELATTVARQAPAYTTVPAGATQAIHDVRVDARTSSRRARTLVLATGTGDVTLRGNDIRYVLRSNAGELLPSTAITVSSERDAAGRLQAVVIRGRGNGHGVGLCQWGAIARARAGADFRAILKAYYPGAEITRAP